jgi:3-methyladenine DNA glycosylase AlkC
MAEPFKNLINQALVRDAAAQLRRVAPGFDAPSFSALACQGLDALEMKARSMHICSALEATLPADFNTAAGVIEAALAPAEADFAMAQLQGLQRGLRGWILWPVGEYIARHGQATPERALQALHAITQRFTAEFAIRPFIVNHPGVVWPTLQRWCSDDSAHVRRLVSEGSRPRLPWGLQLKSLVADPSPTLPLLLALQDDPSDYVRRSVANHLNDIAKDHPALVADWLHTHLPDAPATRRTLLRHASRTLIKQGHPQVLKAWGLGTPLRGTASLALSPPLLVLGQDLTLTLQLHSSSAKPQTLAIDYAVHHVKASGSTSAKVFKGWKALLPAHGTLTLTKRHPVRPITTRRYHSGVHRVVVQANGKPVAQAAFDLQLAPA